MFPRLMEQGAIARAGRGRPRRRGMRVAIPPKSDERRRGPFDRAICRQRSLVERLINRFKQFRRLATRCEKLAATYQAMGAIAALRFWL